jgi:hypothetical protein
MNSRSNASAVVVAGALLVAGAAFAEVTGYDSLPTPPAPNVPSVGFEATSTAEFGDQVRLVPSSLRKLSSVVVTMSSWACESGGGASCATTPGSTFDHPITLNIYAVDNSVVPPRTGAVLATKTVSFSIPYRPSVDPTCPGGTAWRAGDGNCYNGLANDIEFDMTDLAVTLPDDIIWGIAYNTSHHGYSPLGGAGGPYDSLNVGTSPAATVGTDEDPDAAFLNSTWAGAYCDSGAAGTGVFRYDGSLGCWAGYVPAAQFNFTDPNDVKDVVLAQLQALLPTLTKPNSDKVKSAIDHLKKSMNPKFWVDGVHLTQSGKTVFDEEKKSVHELENVSPRSLVQSAIDALVADDRTLASIAISESTKPAGDITKANNEIAKGDTDRANGKYEEAIGHYKNAWDLAT